MLSCPIGSQKKEANTTRYELPMMTYERLDGFRIIRAGAVCKSEIRCLRPKREGRISGNFHMGVCATAHLEHSQLGTSSHYHYASYKNHDGFLYVPFPRLCEFNLFRIDQGVWRGNSTMGFVN